MLVGLRDQLAIHRATVNNFHFTPSPSTSVRKVNRSPQGKEKIIKKKKVKHGGGEMVKVHDYVSSERGKRL